MTDEHSEQKAQYTNQGKMAFVVGGMGEVGKEVVKLLLKEKIFSRVVLIGRRKVNYEDELYKDVEQRVVDFDNLDKHADDFKGFDVGFSCLGTTRSKAGAEGFYKVDHDYVVNSAKLAADGGCKMLHLVTAVGSNKNSVFLYAKTKGQVEAEVAAMNFEHLFIYRPGLLLCDREDREGKEKALVFVSKPVTCLFPTLMSVPTDTIAKAMLNNTITAVQGEPKVKILENKAIHHAAK